MDPGLFYLIKCILGVEVLSWQEAQLEPRLTVLLGIELTLACRYVGGAPGKIDLYVGKEVVRRAIPMDDATNQLIELIKEHDRSGLTNLYRLETCTQPCLIHGSFSIQSTK